MRDYINLRAPISLKLFKYGVHLASYTGDSPHPPPQPSQPPPGGPDFGTPGGPTTPGGSSGYPPPMPHTMVYGAPPPPHMLQGLEIHLVTYIPISGF